jgi:hypothetical protein
VINLFKILRTHNTPFIFRSYSEVGITNFYFFLERLNLSKLIDISTLSKSLPRLTSLWTSGFDLYPDENLGRLAASIVTHFEQLIELIINKGSHNRHHGNVNLEILFTQQKYIENLLRNIPKLCDSSRTNIFWTHFTELQIWL